MASRGDDEAWIHTQQCLMLVREKLPADTYKKFVKTMLDIRKQSSIGPDGVLRIICPEDCIEKIMKLFHGQLQVKQSFLNLIKGRSPFDHNAIVPQIQKPMDFIHRMKSSPEISKQVYDDFMKTVRQFPLKKTMTTVDVYYKIGEILANCPEFLQEFVENYLPPSLVVLLSDEQIFTPCETCNTSRATKKSSPCSELIAEEYKGDKVEPLPDYRDKNLPPRVNPSSCERPTASYKRCSPLKSSYETKLGRSVLNHDLVSFISGREDQDQCKQKQTQSAADGDHDRKTIAKNKYELYIFRAENDLYESDMALQRIRTTANFIGALKKRAGSDMKILDHLTSIHRRCIQSLYGNTQHNYVLDALMETQNVRVALAVLRSRLNRKIKELAKARLSLDTRCSKIIAENYYRSLDYRSSSFKQWDMKRMSHKALLAESNKINKSNLNAGDYTDSAMHEEMISIISYACDNEDTMMKRWTRLVHPVLSVNCLWLDLSETLVPNEACQQCGLSKDFLSSMPDDLSTDNSEPEEQHESKQDPQRHVKPRGTKHEICCSLVVLRRLYQILYNRLQVARRLSRAGDKRLSEGDSCTSDLYAVFNEKLRSLLDRSIDQCSFENFCLQFLGPESFRLFTLDRLVIRATKQLRVSASIDEDDALFQFLDKLRSRPTLLRNSSSQFDLGEKVDVVPTRSLIESPETLNRFQLFQKKKRSKLERSSKPGEKDPSC